MRRLGLVVVLLLLALAGSLLLVGGDDPPRSPACEAALDRLRTGPVGGVAQARRAEEARRVCGDELR